MARQKTRQDTFRIDEVERLLAAAAAERLGMPYYTFLRHCVLSASRQIMAEPTLDCPEDLIDGEEWKL